MANLNTPEEFDTDSLSVGGMAFEQMLAKVDLKKQFDGLRKDIVSTKSPSKKDGLIKKLKYVDGLRRSELLPQHAYILHNIPVSPPITRPVTIMGNNSIEYADVNELYKDHMTLNNSFSDINGKDGLPPDQVINERRGLYEGAKAIFGVGEAISGAKRGAPLKGYIRQISGVTGPKGGLFHSKILSKKLDFSGRATIYAEPNLGFNEAAIPEDMLWSTYKFHILRDLVKQGFDYPTANKAITARNPAATSSFNKLIKQIPVLLNRAPTLMRTNITAHFPVPIKGNTIGINPLHLPMYAGDYDGDALVLHVPLTPEAIEEAKTKLLPMHHIHDYRKGQGNSMVVPGHEAVIGSVFLTEPDTTQKPVHFATEEDALAALKAGTIKENTPLTIS